MRRWARLGGFGLTSPSNQRLTPRRVAVVTAIVVLVVVGVGVALALQRPYSAAPMSDAAAAASVRPTGWEPRARNQAANHRIPTPAELREFRRETESWGRCNWLKGRITGAFVGTTDEILQWGARKWGLDEDLMRAVAVQESRWRASAVGDSGQSFGLTQVKRTAHGGTFPLARDSSAFNVDYYGAYIRYYLNGCATWLQKFDRRVEYRSGDLWGSIGAWFSGRWYSDSGQDYVRKVRRYLAERPWTEPGF